MAWKNLKNLIFMGIVVLAIVGCTISSASIVTTTYEFLTDQSTVITYGPPSPPHIFYVEGRFQLTVNYDIGKASFDWVDSSNIWGDSIGDIFYMTELDGTVVSDSRIDFLSESTNPIFPYCDILLELTFTDDSVRLTSRTFYPRYEVDAPFYVLDAIAVPEPTSILILAFGGLIVRRRFF